MASPFSPTRWRTHQSCLSLLGEASSEI